jgi:DNA-binding transcriptional LysR family regulator
MFTGLLQRGGLSLDRLQTFCLVAQAAGVTRAAQGDPTRQSLYSRQIKELEEFFGTELIRRKGRGIVVTEAGLHLHVIARECFATLSDFQRGCEDQPVEVVLGTGESVTQWLLMPCLDKLRQHLPKVRLKFLNLTTAEAVKRLAEGMIDFALVRRNAIARPLQARSLGMMRYALFVPPPLQSPATRRKPGWKLLEGLPLATLEGEGSFRSALAQAAKKEGVTLNIQIECSTFPLAARAVAQGVVAAILPAIATADLPAAAATQLPVSFLKKFDREMCLASSPRLLRIRPKLQQVAAVIAQWCRF